jgi:beta-lactamase regulating signal transducer with metallopeptidase domain/archaellum component FlaC
MSTLTAFILAALKVLVLLAATAGVAFALRKRPARVRAVLWGSSLAGSLLIPLAAPVLPQLELPFPEPVAKWTARPDTAVTGSIDARLETAPEMTADRDNAAISASATARDSKPAVNWLAIMASIWAIAAAALLARLALGLWRVAGVVRRAQSVNESDWQRQLELARTLVGFRRPVRLLASDEVEVPATVGLFRPTIVLPRVGQSWVWDRRRAVLLHELVHIDRFDWPVRIAARVARAIYWFNPLVWWAVRRLDLEQELASDEEVLALGTRASSYACHLLGVARHALTCPAPAIPALGMARRTHLEERIMSILERKNPRRVGLAVLIPTVALIAVLVPAIAAVALGSSDPRPASSELKSVVAEFDEIELKMEPYLAEIEDIEIDMDVHIDAIEDLEVQIDESKFEAIEEKMKPYLEKLENIEIDMEPLHDHLAELEDELKDLELHIEDGTLEEVERQIHFQVQAHMEKMEQIQMNMEPFHEQMEKIHQEMEPLYKEMQEIHVDMEPIHAQMEKIHIDMEPFQEQMEKIHEQLEPFHEEMEALHDRLDAAIRDEIEIYLREQLGAVTAPGTDFSEAAAKIAEDSRIHINDDVVEIKARANNSRAILEDLFGPQRVGTKNAFRQAIDDTVAGLSPLRITVD